MPPGARRGITDLFGDFNQAVKRSVGSSETQEFSLALGGLIHHYLPESRWGYWSQFSGLRAARSGQKSSWRGLSGLFLTPALVSLGQNWLQLVLVEAKLILLSLSLRRLSHHVAKV